MFKLWKRWRPRRRHHYMILVMGALFLALVIYLVSPSLVYLIENWPVILASVLFILALRRKTPFIPGARSAREADRAMSLLEGAEQGLTVVQVARALKKDDIEHVRGLLQELVDAGRVRLGDQAPGTQLLCYHSVSVVKSVEGTE